MKLHTFYSGHTIHNFHVKENRKFRKFFLIQHFLSSHEHDFMYGNLEWIQVFFLELFYILFVFLWIFADKTGTSGTFCRAGQGLS